MFVGELVAPHPRLIIPVLYLSKLVHQPVKAFSPELFALSPLSYSRRNMLLASNVCEKKNEKRREFSGSSPWAIILNFIPVTLNI